MGYSPWFYHNDPKIQDGDTLANSADSEQSEQSLQCSPWYLYLLVNFLHENTSLFESE